MDDRPPPTFAPIIEALADVRYTGFVNPFMHGEPSPDELSQAMIWVRENAR